MSQHARIDILSKLKGSDPHLLRMILAGFLITGAAANIAGCFLVGPCLDVGPCLSPPIDNNENWDQGGDMQGDMEQGDLEVMPCLTAPPPDMEVGPCLGALPPDMDQDMAPQEDMPVTPCLDVPAPDMGQDMGSLTQPVDKQLQVAQRQEILDKLSSRLPADVVARLQAPDPEQS